MESPGSTVLATLGFTRAEDVERDDDRPGLLRARTLPIDVDARKAFDHRLCRLNDCADPATPPPQLERSGFEIVDLSSLATLQRALATIRNEDRITEELSSEVRASLEGQRLGLNNGGVIRIDHVADEGMIMRRAGPNGLDVNPGGMDGANGHDGASAIHADQDVFGTPLAQMMGGEAPNLFRHCTPDARNDDSSLFLLNLWIPLQQITRPLVLMDRTTLDPTRHQLRYGLPVDRFLDRDDEQTVNDIWHFLPDPGQTWYFHSALDSDHCYVFDTLGTPHGACILPGEDVLEALVQVLDRACQAVAESDDETRLEIAASEPPPLREDMTEPIRRAAQQMIALLHDLERPAPHWQAEARSAVDQVIRKSVEMRVVATLTS